MNIVDQPSQAEVLSRCLSPMVEMPPDEEETPNVNVRQNRY